MIASSQIALWSGAAMLAVELTVVLPVALTTVPDVAKTLPLIMITRSCVSLTFSTM
jgi:hypothetical protein